MNQPTLKTAFKLILAVIITFGLSLAIQSALAIYNGPACPPPGCNVPAPINVGSSTNPITQTMFDTLNVGQQQIYHVGGIGVAGILTVNTDTLLTNLQNRVMIGTTAPIGSSKLTIEMGAPNGEGLHIHRLANAPYSYLKITDEGNLPIFTVHESGNVGIGTGNPQAKLSVGGDGDANSMASINGGAGKMYGLYVNGGTSVSIYGDNTFGSGVTGWSTNAAGVYGNTQSGYGVYGNNAGASGYGVFGNGPTGGFFQSSAAGPALVTGTGNVGIGTANPGYKLDVQGSLSADTIRLKTNASQGRVLMSDNLGNASWVATSSLGLGGGGGAVAMASGEINDGQQIPLPAGVTDQSNCKWTVSFGQNLTSLFSAYPTFYNTDVGADRIVHAIVSVPGYPAQPGTANYLIVCNTGGGSGSGGAPDFEIIQAVSAGQRYTIPHGLGVTPKLVQVYYCRSTDPTCTNRMFVADRNRFTPGGDYGVQTAVDSTNIRIRVGGSGVYLSPENVDLGAGDEASGFYKILAWKTGGGGTLNCWDQAWPGGSTNGTNVCVNAGGVCASVNLGNNYSRGCQDMNPPTPYTARCCKVQ